MDTEEKLPDEVEAAIAKHIDAAKDCAAFAERGPVTRTERERERDTGVALRTAILAAIRDARVAGAADRDACEAVG